VVGKRKKKSRGFTSVESQRGLPGKWDTKSGKNKEKPQREKIGEDVNGGNSERGTGFLKKAESWGQELKLPRKSLLGDGGKKESISFVSANSSRFRAEDRKTLNGET